MSAGSIIGPNGRPVGPYTVVASTRAVEIRPINLSSDHAGEPSSIPGSTVIARVRWPVDPAVDTLMTTTTPADVRLRYTAGTPDNSIRWLIDTSSMTTSVKVARVVAGHSAVFNGSGMLARRVGKIAVRVTAVHPSCCVRLLRRALASIHR
jgi:hypothetical protein